MKIRTQLAYLFAVIVATLLLLFSIGIYFLSARYREREFYERLREKAVTTARLLYEANQQISPQTLKLIDEQDSTVLDAEKVMVFDENLKVIYGSNADKATIDNKTFELLKTRKEILIQKEETEYLYMLVEEQNKVVVVMVSAIDLYGISKLNFLLVILFFGWSISVIIIVITGWIFAGNVLQPISEVIHQVESIDLTTLDTTRVKAGNEKDEISQLADTFNRMLDRLQKSFLIQKSFVSNASHELRTPLTAMSGQLEVTLLDERSPEEYHFILQSVLDDVKDMTDLANGLLDLAQASSDAFALPFRKTRIDEVVLQAEADLLKKRPKYNVIVDFKEVAEEEELFEMNVNERLLRTAFLNLMENACKFSNDQTVEVNISFKPEEIILKFSDKGFGIADSELPFIFEPFYRSDNVKTIAGHGIGLPLTQKIIELHKGEISIESVVNSGTCFTITLPRSREKSE